MNGSLIGNIKLGVNKLNEIRRLTHEISIRNNLSVEKVFELPDVSAALNNSSLSPNDKFRNIKKALISARYPNASRQKDFAVYFNRFEKKSDAGKIYRAPFVPEKIFVQKSEVRTQIAKNVKSMFPGVKTEYFETLKEYRLNNPSSGYDPKKRDLIVACQQWDFIKPCPCTKNAVCCGYHVFNLGFGCPFDCSYCFLGQYANLPGIVIDSNPGEFLGHCDKYFLELGGRFVRIGTGEFSDSLALDHITEYSKILVPYFADKNVLFELKTKSSNVLNLIGLEHKGRTAVSWSVNPEVIVQNEEHGTASLEERFKAAKVCYNAGYKIGFHFDPIIHFENWEEQYENVVEKMFDTVENIEWISLGTFRCNRMLKPVIEARFPQSKYIYGELVIGEDKKIRYYSVLRQEIYTKMISFIKKRNPKTKVYLCMETKDIWSKIPQCDLCVIE